MKFYQMQTKKNLRLLLSQINSNQFFLRSWKVLSFAAVYGQAVSTSA